jgi:hypothetical protein
MSVDEQGGLDGATAVSQGEPSPMRRGSLRAQAAVAMREAQRNLLQPEIFCGSGTNTAERAEQRKGRRRGRRTARPCPAVYFGCVCTVDARK